MPVLDLENFETAEGEGISPFSIDFFSLKITASIAPGVALAKASISSLLRLILILERTLPG